MKRPAPSAVVAPATIAYFRQRLAETDGHLPRRLQQCADHLASRQDLIAVSTVAQLAAGAGVPASAMMRFCQTLGFSGYSDLQRMFRAALTEDLPDYATRLANLTSGPVNQPAALVAEFVEAGRRSLGLLAQDLDPAALERAVATLSQARLLHLVGYRRALPVAAYLAYVFQQLDIPVRLQDGIAPAGPLNPDEGVLAVTFAPYAAETLAFIAAARDHHLPVVVLTDPPAGALASLADVILPVAELDFGKFRSLSATIALALALALAIASRRKETG